MAVSAKRYRGTVRRCHPSTQIPDQPLCLQLRRSTFRTEEANHSISHNEERPWLEGPWAAHCYRGTAPHPPQPCSTRGSKAATGAL